MPSNDCKYPCCVCLLSICVGADCPAANGDEEIYITRMKERIDKEIPCEEED